MRIAIVGSRNYPRLDLVVEFVVLLPEGTVVGSGDACGVDQMAVSAAKACGLKTVEHLADWALHGRAAGMIRNRVMLDDVDEVVAFWNRKSRGTLNMIEITKRAGKRVTVIEPPLA